METLIAEDLLLLLLDDDSGRLTLTSYPQTVLGGALLVELAMSGAVEVGEGAGPDDRTGVLVALLSAIDKPHKVVDHRGLSSKEVRKRAKRIAEGDWAAKAVRDAIAASTAAVSAAVASTAATAATTAATTT